MTRATAERLVIVMRRNSTSSSGDTQISVWTSRPAWRLPKLRARLGENGFVALGRAHHGLIRGGPEFARRQIAQIDKRSPAIAGGILAPAGDRQIAPATVAAAGAADDDMITAVGQEMNLRRRREWDS
jgi:hypothetical protein